MDDWISFEGRIVPMEWGKSTYTVLPIPQEIYQALKEQGAKRVDVELNDSPFNMALTKAPALDHVFVYTGKTVLRDAGIQPGDLIDVRMRKADPDMVDVPSDVQLALRESDVTDLWNALSAGKKRGLLHAVTSAKREATRQARLAKMIAELKAS